MEEQRVARGRI